MSVLVHDLFHAELQSSGSEDLKEALGLGESPGWHGLGFRVEELN